MKPFSLLVKPASSACNIACGYCFYRDTLSSVYNRSPADGRMTLATAENLIRSFLRLTFPAVSICFQGGEPLLMGLNFYRQLIEFEKKYGFDGQAVGNSFQTNGLLITDEWAAFFRDYNMLVGISLDGERDIHDHYRRAANGEGTFDRVMEAIGILKRHRVEFNILAMVTSRSAQQVDRTYRFFRSQGLGFLQFIPCVERDPADGSLTELSVTAEQYGEFLKRLFDLWCADGRQDVSIRLFDDIVAWHADGRRNSCCFRQRCDSYFVIEHNGDVYPCDFYVDRKWRLGNINGDDFASLCRSPTRAAFAAMKARVPAACSSCRHVDFCRGDCSRLRGPAGSGPADLCPGFRSFLDYSEPRFRAIAADIRRQPRGLPAGADACRSDGRTPGRNAPCPCGSGRKYKQCCGATS